MSYQIELKKLRRDWELVDNSDYIKYIRSNGCRVCGKFPVDPDHLTARGMGGAGKGGTVTNTKKDFTCIPLCRLHHTERHQLGNEKFEKKYNINVWKDAHQLVVNYFAD